MRILVWLLFNSDYSGGFAMFRACTNIHVSAVKVTSVVFSVISLWVFPPSTAFGQVEVEAQPTWYEQVLSTFGSPDSPLLKSERERQELTEDAVDQVHDHFQDSVNENSIGAQMKGLEPTIVADRSNGQVTLIEVQMRTNSIGAESPFVFVWGTGRDFNDAFVNGNPQPVLSRDVPDAGMIDFDESYFVLEYGMGGNAHFEITLPPGWNQGTTRADRDQLALRLAGPYQYRAQCAIDAINAQQKAAALASVNAALNAYLNSAIGTAIPSIPSLQPLAGPAGSHNPPGSGHTGSGPEGHQSTEGGGPGGGAGAGGGAGHGEGGEVIHFEPGSTITVHTGGGEEDLVSHTPSQHLQSLGVVAPSSPPQNSSPTQNSGIGAPVSIPRAPFSVNNGIQGGIGTIKGSVSDPRGAPMVYARVTLKSEVHGTVDSMYTDATGHFYFFGLPTGPTEKYDLSVSAYPQYSSIEVFPVLEHTTPLEEPFTLQPRTVNHDVNWGLAATRAWVDLNGDGEVDFCRILPQRTPTQHTTGPEDQSRQDTDVLACDLSSGPFLEKLYQGVRSSTPVPTEARSNRFAWVHFHDAQHLDFCRAVPTSSDGRKGKLVCILWEGTGFGKTVSTPDDQPIDLGIPSGRAWVDFNGDGRADFCTLIVSVKLEHQLACWVSKGDGFIDTPIVSYDVKWPDNPKLRAWVDVNADGRMDFCSVQGANNEFFECALSSGHGFEPPIRDLIRQPVKP